jgi:hypothetical protein
MGSRAACVLIAAVGLAFVFACSSSSSSAPPPPPPPEVILPCDVDAAMKASCRPCHSNPPAHGAPMALITFDDTRAPWTQLPTYDNTPTWKVIGDVIDANWMPQPLKGVELTPAQRQTLLSWVHSGAPAAPSGTVCP